MSGLLVAAAFVFLADAAAVPETSSQWKLVTKVFDDCAAKDVRFYQINLNFKLKKNGIFFNWDFFCGLGNF